MKYKRIMHAYNIPDKKYFEEQTHKLHLDSNVIFTGKIDSNLLKSVYANENSFAAVTEDNKVYYQRSVLLSYSFLSILLYFHFNIAQRTFSPYLLNRLR